MIVLLISKYLDAFAATGIDPAFYAHRERGFDELLPWDHIGVRLSRKYLEKSYADVLARAGEHLPVSKDGS